MNPTGSGARHSSLYDLSREYRNGLAVKVLLLKFCCSPSKKTKAYIDYIDTK